MQKEEEKKKEKSQKLRLKTRLVKQNTKTRAMRDAVDSSPTTATTTVLVERRASDTAAPGLNKLYL